MVPRTMAGLVAALLLHGCASTEPGWSGQSATPFGTAEADCKAATAAMADKQARAEAFTACMADKGWTRT